MCTTDINDADGKFATGWQVATGINDTGSKFATVVNDTAVANNGNNIRLLRP
jgi:hypothetical protein